jgi:hypothetical protein
MTVDYHEVLPKGILFNLKQIEEINLIKVSMSKKLIAHGQLEAVKIGNKLYIARVELLRFLEKRTVQKNIDEN